MKKTVLFFSFLLACITGMAGNMDKYTINPASGSAVTENELKNVTLTFPDADGVKESDFSIYVYYNEDTQHSIWETKISLEPGSKLKFDGNSITMDISEIAEKYSGDLYFVIDTYSLKSESYDYAPRMQWMYHLASSFDGMTATPADGSTVSPADFNKLTLTFPNITELKLNESRRYCGFELRTVEGDQWIANGNLHDWATINGNTLSLDIKQEWKASMSGKIKVEINRDALVDGTTGAQSAAIELIYDVAVKQFECTVTPSNAEALPITAFHDLAFTFIGAQKVELPVADASDFTKMVSLRRYTRDGFENYGFYDADDVTIEGNVVKIRMSVSAIKGGKYTLFAERGAFTIDGYPSQEISMEYELLPFETKFDVKCAESLDLEGRLNIILPTDLNLDYAVTQGLVNLKNAEGLPTDFLVIANYSKENNTAWFTFEKSGGDILPDGSYHFYLKSESIVMFSEDGIMVASRGSDIYFTKDSTSGIHDVRIVTDGKAYTLDGRPAMPNRKGIVVVNGVKTVCK